MPEHKDNTYFDFSGYQYTDNAKATSFSFDENEFDNIIVTNTGANKNGRQEQTGKVVYYNSHPSGVECIDIIKHYDLCIGTAMKYLWRCGLKVEEGMTPKEKEIEDLEKAKQYIDYKIKMLKEKL